jgi:hypothetical protein
MVDVMYVPHRSPPSDDARCRDGTTLVMADRISGLTVGALLADSNTGTKRGDEDLGCFLPNALGAGRVTPELGYV